MFLTCLQVVTMAPTWSKYKPKTANGTANNGKAAEPAASDYDVNEHLMGVAEVGEKYATNVDDVTPSRSQGLSGAEVCLCGAAKAAL
jgi:hypothetical protein